MQKAFDIVPGGTWLNYALQRTVGGYRNPQRVIDGLIQSDFLVQAEYFAELGFPLAGARLVEIGTGWFPTFPICYGLCGAAACTTFDINRHIKPALTFAMLRRLEHHLPAIAAAGRTSLAQVGERYERLRGASTVEQLLERAHVEYRAPADFTSSKLAGDSVDVVFSNSVLEHVPADVIRLFMRESTRVLRPGGLVVHDVNCGDHYAYFDRTITQVHYLRYGDAQWRRWNSRALYQNRLRATDFVHMATEAGLEICRYVARARPELMEEIRGIKLPDEFRGYTVEELAPTSVALVGRKP